MARTYTDAPERYDGFGTKTVKILGTISAGRPVRLVETPDEHIEWQRTRYGSGMYFAADETEWQRIKFLLVEGGA